MQITSTQYYLTIALPKHLNFTLVKLHFYRSFLKTMFLRTTLTFNIPNIFNQRERFFRGGLFSNVINLSIEPLIHNLAKSAIEFARFSSDFVTTMERRRNAASQCLCRPLFRSIAEVYFLDFVHFHLHNH